MLEKKNGKKQIREKPRDSEYMLRKENIEKIMTRQVTVIFQIVNLKKKKSRKAKTILAIKELLEVSPSPVKL